MPRYGLLQVRHLTCVVYLTCITTQVVYQAIKAGYRCLDGASDYGEPRRPLSPFVALTWTLLV